MKRHFIILAAALLASTTLAAQTSTQRARLERHVYTLASDSLQGRQAGSPDAEKARQYIEGEWRTMGLKPMWGDSYRMPFRLGGNVGYCNLVALIEGCDPVLKQEYIVVGGHYDHLGVRDGVVYNGADDNASGTACVTEVARQLLARQSQMKRSVIICAFDAEEIGLHGSSFLASRLKELNMIGRVKLMMSVDMVGWLRQGGALQLEGSGTLAKGDALTDPKALGIDIVIHTKRFESSIFTATDTEPFAKQGVATLAVTTGIKSPYHKPEDDAELIDYEGLDRVTDYLAAFTIKTANHQGDIASGRVADKHRAKARPFEFGLQIGYNNSWLRFPEASFVGEALAGIHGGLALQFNMSKYLSLHADILYAYYRTAVPDFLNPFYNAFRLHQQAVTVPLTLSLNLGDVANRFSINLGAYASMLTSSDINCPDRPEYPHSMDVEYALPAEFGLTWGVSVRLGYHYELKVDNAYPFQPLFFTEDSHRPGLKTFPRRSMISLIYYF